MADNVITPLESADLSKLEALVAGLSSQGVTLVNATLTGAPSAVGVFDSLLLSDTVKFGPGVLITSGNGSPERINDATGRSTSTGQDGDPDLTAFAMAAFPDADLTFDATVITLTFLVTDPNVNSIKFSLAFGSEEYPEFADSDFVDIAAVWTGTGLSAINYALVNGDPTTPLATITKNITLGNFFDNGAGGLAIQYDGLILNQTVQVPVKLGLNVIKIGVADTDDRFLDSGLFIHGISASKASGGGTLQQVSVGQPGGTFSGADNNFLFSGTSQNLNNSVIQFFNELDQIFVDGSFFSDFNVSLDFGSLILNLDTDGNGTADTTITLEDPIPNATIVISQEQAGTSISLDELDQPTEGDDVFTGTDGLQYLAGGGGSDLLSGLGGSDVLVGDGGNDTLVGGAGDDELQGGTGSDTARFSGKRSDYKVEQLQDGSFRITDQRSGAPDGTDTISAVESFQFSDKTLTAANVVSGGDVMPPAPAGLKTFVGGGNVAEDLRANVADADGTSIQAGGGNDTLRGGKFDDLLTGGSGDDQMFGGAGADQFRFFGDQVEGASDRDRIFDLSFAAGDKLVFGSFAGGTFTDSVGVNAFAGGSSAIIGSLSGLVEAAAASTSVTALRASPNNNNLLLTISNGNGQVQEILITDAWTQFVAAGGSDGL